MHDIRLIRETPAAFDAGLARRGLSPSSAGILDLDAQRRAAQTRLQELLQSRNMLSQQIGRLKAQQQDAGAAMTQVAAIKDQAAALEQEEQALALRLETMLAMLPNIPAEDVPPGAGEAENVEIRRSGEPRKDAHLKEHHALGEALGLMDAATAARISGARFTILKGPLARLERALGQFMLDLHTGEFGYTECEAPLLVRDTAAYGTGNLPKFAEDLFQTTTGHYLIPTAEMVLTNFVADQIVAAEELPLRLTALTPCFRSEAGAAGKDTVGMLRQHQFYKVELVSIVAPEHSNDEHERMTGAAETVLKRLGLPFRTIVLCTGDMGFSARKTYDIEVWLPGQGRYREISSCSNCGDFQGRRMKARCRARGEKETRFVHTLNGSGVAVGRALIAVMENYQQADGSIAVPDALKPYMGGLDKIERPG